MRFKLKTLIDITETKKRKEDGIKAFSQQSNYNTVLQTIGLRVNLNPVSVLNTVDNISEFGDNYVGKQRVWTFMFDIEYEGALNIDMLKQDFDLIPIITNLDETIALHNKVFRTTCPKDTNIHFELLDD